MSDNSNSTSIQIGPGLIGTLTIVFVLLKAFGYIDWTWWWVFSPLWIGIPLAIGIVLLFMIVVGVLALIAK